LYKYFLHFFSQLSFDTIATAIISASLIFILDQMLSFQPAWYLYYSKYYFFSQLKFNTIPLIIIPASPLFIAANPFETQLA